MESANDLLDAVVDELRRRNGELASVALAAELSYDTVLRIKNRENDPGYSKVRRLAQSLGIKSQVTPPGGMVPAGGG